MNEVRAPWPCGCPWVEFDGMKSHSLTWALITNQSFGTGLIKPFLMDRRCCGGREANFSNGWCLDYSLLINPCCLVDSRTRGSSRRKRWDSRVLWVCKPGSQLTPSKGRVFGGFSKPELKVIFQHESSDVQPDQDLTGQCHAGAPPDRVVQSKSVRLTRA